jgi:hypothetical protein
VKTYSGRERECPHRPESRTRIWPHVKLLDNGLENRRRSSVGCEEAGCIGGLERVLWMVDDRLGEKGTMNIKED